MRRMVKLVILAPYYEVATFIWSPYLKGWVSNELRKRCGKPVLLWADDANRRKLWEAVKDTETYGVLGVGHGWERGIVGQNNEVLLRVGDEITPEWRKVVFAPVSCLVGKELVPWLVEQGVPAGIGEVTEYWFTAEKIDQKGESPEEDKLLKYFLYAEYTFWFRLAEGATAGEAYDAMIEEYKRQAELAKQVDPMTYRCLVVDLQNRKFFGDRNYKLPLAPGRILTRTEVSAAGKRLPKDRRDVVTVTGRVVAEDGSVPKGWVTIRVVSALGERSDSVALGGDGTFSATFEFQWERNEDVEYSVTVAYGGWVGERCYAPSRAETVLLVKMTLVPTALRIEKAVTVRDGPLVHFGVAGRLIDADGVSLAGKVVEIAAGDGELRRAWVETREDGTFTAEVSKSYPPLQTRAAVVARFARDDLYQGSEDMRIVEFPPNWDFVKIIAAVAAAAALLLALLLASIL